MDKSLIALRGTCAILFLAFSSVACGNGSNRLGAPDKAGSDEGSSGVADRYFEALATDNPQSMQAILQLSNPESPAHLYARIQIALSQTLADDGRPPTQSQVEETGDGLRLCMKLPPPGPPGLAPSPPRPEDLCSLYSNFKVDSEGDLLTDFTVDGKAISDRLVAGGDAASAAGARFTLIGGYQSVQSEHFFMVVEVANGPQKINVYGNSATYVGADGRQVKALDSAGPLEVQPSARSLVAIRFIGVTPGGRLILEGADSDLTASYEVSLQTK